jgi:hypothetical protein
VERESPGLRFALWRKPPKGHCGLPGK